MPNMPSGKVRTFFSPLTDSLGHLLAYPGHTPYIWRLYKAIAILKMVYALPVWYTLLSASPSATHKKGSVRIMNAISKAQRMACKRIMGAFKSAPSDMLEVLADIPPVWLHLAETCYREALRLCSLPKGHPLFTHIRSAAKPPPRFHRSPIHTMLHTFALKPVSIETISPTHQHPAWEPLVTMHVAADKDEAAHIIHTRIDQVKVFTDGSGIHTGNYEKLTGHLNPVKILNLQKHLQQHVYYIIDHC